MADSAEALIRSGAISGKQAARHKLKAQKGTKVERPNEETFDGKQGLRDQGAGKQRGDRVGNVRHIDGPDQGMGNSKPSKGVRVPNPRGAANAGKINGTVEDPDEIDESSNQRPSFPTQGRGRETGNKLARGKIAKQGGQYGGGGQNTQ